MLNRRAFSEPDLDRDRGAEALGLQCPHGMGHLSLRSLFVLAVAFATLASVRAQADDNGPTLHVANLTADDGEKVDVEIPLASEAELEAVRPAKIYDAAEIYRTQLRASCAARIEGNAVVRFVKSYPMEAATFNIAVATSAWQQMHEDPAYWRHYVENSIVDPMAHATFVGFMLGNRAASALMALTQLTFDPCRVLAKNPNASMSELAAKRYQKAFKFVEGGIGMTVGLGVSTLMREALTDPNIQMCAAYQIGKTLQKDADKAKKACDVAYNDWVLGDGHKIRGLVPDAVSQIGVSAILGGIKWGSQKAANTEMVQGAKKAIGARASIVTKQAGKLVIDSGAAAARLAATGLDYSVYRVAFIRTGGQFASRMIMRGFSLAMNGAKFMGPSIPRFVVSTGGMILFFVGSDWINPWVKPPLERLFAGHDAYVVGQTLSRQFDELDKNHYVIAPPADGPECHPKPGVMYGTHDWEPMVPSWCFRSPERPPWENIELMGRIQSDWRNTLATDVNENKGHWDNFVLHFATMYGDAYRFYHDIAMQILEKHTGANPSDSKPIYEPAPLWGIGDETELKGADGQPKWDGQICHLPAHTIERARVAAEKIRAELQEELRAPIVLPTFGGHGFGLSSDGSFTIDIHLTNKPRFALPVFAGGVDITKLTTLLEGVLAMDCARPIPNIGRDLHKDQKHATPAELEKLRYDRIHKMVTTLWWTLREYNGPFTDNRNDFTSDQYIHGAQRNIFMIVNILLGRPEDMPIGATYIRDKEYDKAVISPDTKDDHPVFLNEVDTKAMPDYLLASMVCGPNVENAITKHKGWDVDFTPFNIVNPQALGACGANKPVDPVIVGNFVPEKGIVAWLYDLVPGGSERPGYDPYLSTWKIQGKTYKGLLEIVKTFANASIIGREWGKSTFDNWWDATVGNRATAQFKEYHDSYVHDIVEKRFWPLLKDQTTVTSWLGLVVNTATFGHYHSKPLAKGLGASLLQSVDDNFAMLAKIVDYDHLSKEHQKIFDLAQYELQTRMAIQLQLVSPMNDVQAGLKAYEDAFGASKQLEIELDNKGNQLPRKKWNQVTSYNDELCLDTYKENEEQMQSYIKQLQILGRASLHSHPAAARETIAKMFDAVKTNIEGLVTEIDGYHGIPMSIELSKTN